MAVWRPEGRPRGAILLTQGRTEYIEKAYEWIGKFRDRGLIVCTFDWRGQGLSERELPDRSRGYLRDFADFQTDLDTVYPVLLSACGDLPMLGFGHSMGGLALTRFLHRRRTAMAGAILSAPMLELELKPLTAVFGRVFSRFATGLGFGARYTPGCDERTGPDRGFADNVLTRDRARFDMHADMLERHPELKLGGATWSWLRASFREMAAVEALPPGWLETPVLILQAGDDTVVSNAAHDRFAERNPMAEIAVLPGSRHEPLMEADAVQQAAWAAIDVFLERIAGPV